MVRKRLLCLLFAILLLLSAAPGAAAEEVYFTMLNHNSPEPLNTATMPIARNGNIYVPLSTLNRIGISASHQPGVLRLEWSWDSSVYVAFDLESGSNITSDGGSLPVALIGRFGTWFVPVGSTSSVTGVLAAYFGVSFQIIHTEPAPTVRLYNLPVGVLSHNEVEENGESLFGFAERYNIFIGNTGNDTNDGPNGPPPPETPNPPDEGDDTPSEPNETETDPPRRPGGGSIISISFVGLTEDSYALLDALQTAQISAGFFLTAGDALTHPDFVRRIHGEGHRVGIFLTEEADTEFQAASEALFEAARLRTVLVAAETPEVAQEADALGLVVFNSPLRQMPSGDTAESPSGNLLLDSQNGNARILAAWAGTLRSHTLRVISFVSALS